MIDELSHEQLLAWIEYDAVEPIGSLRADLNTALICQTVHSQLERVIAVNVGRKHRYDRRKLKDFMLTELLSPSQKHREPLTVEEFNRFKSALKASKKPQQ